MSLVDENRPLDELDRLRARVAELEALLREAQQAAERIRNELEQRVAGRTEELAEANACLKSDIEQREQVFAALRESEKRFRFIVDAMPIPIVISRYPEGTILYANEQVAQALGAEPRELVGRQTLDFYHHEADREQLVARIEQDGQLHDFEIRVRRNDGSSRWVSLFALRTRFENEDVLLTGVLDIDRRKQTAELLHNERLLLMRLINLHERDHRLIAYEIHDGLVQDMTAASMFLDATRHAIAEVDPGSIDTLSQAGALLKTGIEEARRMITGLRPPVLDEFGLVPALQNLVADFTVEGELEVEFEHNVRFDRVAPILEMAVYRIAQEAIHNVRKHSESSRAHVSLIQHGDRVEITVRDWGVGFDPLKAKAKRYGLTGIRDRARLFGGEASIRSTLGRGTCVRVELPLDDALPTNGC